MYQTFASESRLAKRAQYDFPYNNTADNFLAYPHWIAATVLTDTVNYSQWFHINRFLDYACLCQAAQQAYGNPIHN